MHVHADAVGFVAFVAMLLIAMFLLRSLAARYPDSRVGQALGVLIA